MSSLIHPMSVLEDSMDRGHVYRTANGVRLTDDKGHEVLDGFSGLWCVNLGYSDHRLIKAAKEQLQLLPYATCFFNESSEPVERLAAALADKFPGSLNHTHFTLGGSDAVDSAIKIALYYHSLKGSPDRKHVISLSNGYHGSSWAGAGVTGLPNMHEHFSLPFPCQHKIEGHFHRRYGSERDPQDHIRSAKAALESKIAEIGSDNVAVFICEPIQGGGGVVVPPDGLLPALRKICRQHDILFIADEVVTGFYRTGSLLASEYEELAPDMVTVAKGITSGYIPLGAVSVTDDIFNVIARSGPEGTVFSHGFTYSGHPVAAAVANECLRIYEDEIRPKIQDLGDYFQNSMKEFQSHDWVSDVRGRGMVLAVELSKADERYEPFPEITDALRRTAYCNGLRMRVFGNGTAGFAPPLVCERRDIDQIVERFHKTLAEVQASHSNIRS